MSSQDSIIDINSSSNQPEQKGISTTITAIIVLFTVIIHSIASLSIKILNPLDDASNQQNIQYIVEYTVGASIIMTLFTIIIACYYTGLKLYQWLVLYDNVKIWCNGKTLCYCVIYGCCDVMTYYIFNFLLLLIVSSTVTAIRSLSIIITFSLMNFNKQNMSKSKIVKIIISYSFIITGTFLLATQEKWSNNYIAIASVLPIIVAARDFTRWKIKMISGDPITTQINAVINVLFLIISFFVWIVVDITIMVKYYGKPDLPYDMDQFYKAAVSVLMAGIIYTVSTTIFQWLIQKNDASVLLVETLKCSNLLWVVIIDNLRFNKKITNEMIYAMILVVLGNLLMVIPFSRFTSSIHFYFADVIKFCHKFG